MLKIKHIILMLTVLGYAAFGQFQTEVSNVGTNAAAFLEIGVGARAMAMGGAYTALSNDPTAMYYNPAGIVWMNNIQLELMHNEWLVGTNFEYLATSMPLPMFNAAIGVSFTMLDFGEQPVRTVENPEGNGLTYGARSFAVGVTYAQSLTDRFSFGLTGKYINEKIFNVSGGTTAIDLGIFYLTPVEGMKLGMSISNFGGQIRLDGRDLDTVLDPNENVTTIDNVPVSYKVGSYPLPQIFRAGISYSKQLGSFSEVTLTTDLLHPSNSTESMGFGIEYGFAGTVFLRGGYENAFEDTGINGLTLGGGIDYQTPTSLGFRIDYAYSDWGILESVHRFSLGLVFN